MKTKLLAGLLLASSWLFTGKAFAGWGVSFGFGHGGYYAPPARVYVAPPPPYYPSYYAPGYATPSPYGYRHGHFVPAHFSYGPYAGIGFRRIGSASRVLRAVYEKQPSTTERVL